MKCNHRIHLNHDVDATAPNNLYLQIVFEVMQHAVARECWSDDIPELFLVTPHSHLRDVILPDFETFFRDDCKRMFHINSKCPTFK